MQALDAAALNQGIEATSSNDGSNLSEHILIASNESVDLSNQKILN